MLKSVIIYPNCMSAQILPRGQNCHVTKPLIDTLCQFIIYTTMQVRYNARKKVYAHMHVVHAHAGHTRHVGHARQQERVFLQHKTSRLK